MNKEKVEFLKEKAKELASTTVVGAIEGMAREVTAERTVTAIKLEEAKMKCSIIGEQQKRRTLSLPK